MEGKLIYLLFLALYLYLQYRAAQKKKQQQSPRESHTEEKPTTERGYRTLDDILKEAQKQFQEAGKKKESRPVPAKTKKEKSFSSSSYKSIADKHNTTKPAYIPLTTTETFSSEGESVFSNKEIEMTKPIDLAETTAAKPLEIDLRQAIIADAVLNRPYA